MDTSRKRIIIDTDAGHDDALALMLLACSEGVDIEAVTAVAGNAAMQDVANNSRYILDLLQSKAPLYSGSETPLVRDLIKARVHGAGGLAGSHITKQALLTGDAPERIVEIVRANPGEMTILLIGPETNLARAFQLDTELPSLIKEVVIMGGAIAVPGNKNRVAEFNIFVDPEAADIVMNAPVKKVMVPLDACNHIALQLGDFEKLKGAALYEPVVAMMAPYIKGIETYIKVSGALMYDPLAAYYLVNPSAYTLEAMDVRVETKGELTRGMTVADRTRWGEKFPNVDVVTHIDGEAFVRDFLSALKEGPEGAR